MFARALLGAQGGHSQGEAGLPGVARGVEQGACRQQVVRQRLVVAGALAAHLKATERPRDRLGRGRPLESGEELAQALLLAGVQHEAHVPVRVGPAPERERLPAPALGPPPARSAEAHEARRPEAQRGHHAREALRRLGRGDPLVGRGVSLERAEHRRLALPVLAPDRLRGGVHPLAALQPQPAAEIHAVDLDGHPPQRRDHARTYGIAIERDLDLGVDALEALLREAEAGGVLVEALEHPLQRRLGLLPAQAVHAQEDRGAGAELVGRPPAGRQLAQARPALGQEGLRAGLVAIERGAALGALVEHVELDLGAVTQVVCEQRRGFEREVPQRVVQETVAHKGRVRLPRSRSSMRHPGA